jgi:mRNA interferase MazF
MEKISMKRSEVWLINLDPTVGAEIRKTRPAIVVNHDGLGILPLRVVVPITDWKDRYVVADWMVKVDPDTSNNLTNPSAADCFQVRSVSQDRFVRKLGQMEDKKMAEIEKALAIVLNLGK